MQTVTLSLAHTFYMLDMNFVTFRIKMVECVCVCVGDRVQGEIHYFFILTIH